MDAKLVEAVHAQINLEFEAAYSYLALACWFETQDLPGFASWMRAQSQEEITHAEKLVDHLIDRGAPVRLHPIDAPPAERDSVGDALRTAQGHEHKVTESIGRLYEMAGEVKDHPASVLLQWFVTEQVEEEKAIGDLIARNDLVERGQGTLLMLDKELSERQG